MILLAVMLESEKLLKELNLRLAHFGDSEIVSQGSPLPDSTASQDTRLAYSKMLAKLVFKIE
jgi:hypothetical protein